MLELGAGTGMVSMFCARYLQPEVVVATDRELGLMRQIRDCAGRNGLVGEGNGGGVFKGWIWEWGRELSRGSGEDDDDDDELQHVGDGEKVEFDVALGADLVCSSLLFPFRIFSSALLVCGLWLYHGQTTCNSGPKHWVQSPNSERLSRALSIPLAMVATSTPDEMMCIMSCRVVLYQVLLCRVALHTHLPPSQKREKTDR